MQVIIGGLTWFWFLFSDTDPVRFWTRGNDIAFPNHWVWALSGVPISVENIAGRENRIDKCLTLTGRDTGGVKPLQPRSCSELNHFICEIPQKFFVEGKYIPDPSILLCAVTSARKAVVAGSYRVRNS